MGSVARSRGEFPVGVPGIGYAYFNSFTRRFIVLSITIIQGKDQGSVFSLSDQIVTIGRDSDNSIQLHDPEASRHHARITLYQGRSIITDLKSSNGIYLNGQLVQESPVNVGDRIQIGRTLLQLGTAEDGCEEGGPEIRFQIDDKPDQSRIVHALGSEAGEGFFRSAPDVPESAWLQKVRAHLDLIYHTTLVVSQTLDIDKLLDRIMTLIFEWVQVDRGCILLYSEQSNQLVPTVSKSRRRLRPGQTPTISRTMLDYVLKTGEGVLTTDAQTDQRWDAAASIVQMGIREAICVPMRGRYGLVGMIYIDTTRRMGPTDAKPASADARDDWPGAPKLTSDHLKLMVAIGHQAALAVEDTQYYLGMVQAERLAAVGQTVAVLSHHIKNILQGIRGGSYLIDLGLKEHEEEYIHKGWGIVEKNQSKISDLVLDMLTLSKERVPQLEMNDLNQVLSDVMELMQGRAHELNVELSRLSGDQIPSFLFDAEQIHRAITNLVTNALDATSEQAKHLTEADENGDETSGDDEVVLDEMANANTVPIPSATSAVPDPPSSRKEETVLARVNVRSVYILQRRVVLVMVDDNGPGVPDEIREQLFQPFFSVNKSGGTGLGLAVTNKIVHEHNGRLEINQSPLGGARFIMELPFNQIEPKENPSSEAGL